MTHDEALHVTEEVLAEALRLLRSAAEILRGPDVQASPAAMRLELALSRAIESISAAEFPRRE